MAAPGGDAQPAPWPTIIFLDVDGVLHPPSGRGRRGHFREECMRALKRLVEGGEAKCVLSSTWRLHEKTTMKVNEALAGVGLCPLVGATPVHRIGSRVDEIEAWLLAHTGVQRWLAVDDIKLEACDRTPARIMKGRALLTKRNHCLNMELAETGIKMLSKQKQWEHVGGQLSSMPVDDCVAPSTTAVPC